MNPGSDSAVKAGCLCAVLDNGRGKGYLGQVDTFVVNVNCPLHSAQDFNNVELYKRAKTGATLVWSITVAGSSYRSCSGQLGGIMTNPEWTDCEAKNVGQANEISPAFQAIREARAKFKDKLETEGYVRSIADLDKTPGFRSPMLAHEFEKVTTKKPLQFPVYSQPKLDGMRCIVNKDGMFSRNGKPVLAAPHIHEALKQFLNSGLEFDGELYNHKLKDNFNKIISLVKKSKPTLADLEESAEHVEYWIYDIRQSDQTFAERIDTLHHMFIPQLGGWQLPKIRLVYTEEVRNQQFLDHLYSEYLGQGFEGQMVRSASGKYDFCRSNNLLKRKERMDAEFELVDILEGRGERSGMAGMCTIKLPDGRTCQTAIIGDYVYAKNLLVNKHKYIGQKVTVLFQNYTPDGFPRFPWMKTVRDYE